MEIHLEVTNIGHLSLVMMLWFSFTVHFNVFLQICQIFIHCTRWLRRSTSQLLYRKVGSVIISIPIWISCRFFIEKMHDIVLNITKNHCFFFLFCCIFPCSSRALAVEMRVNWFYAFFSWADFMHFMHSLLTSSWAKRIHTNFSRALWILQSFILCCSRKSKKLEQDFGW